MKMDKAIAIFSFTREGNRLNNCIQEKLSDRGYLCEGYTAGGLEETGKLRAPDTDIKAWIGRQWGKKNFLFIGAAGIAVRYIAPWVRDKYTDSAVLVMDEKGGFVIPLLSGHMGGAVEIAREIEKSVQAVAVITTATDVRKKFSVDVFAKDNHLKITDRHLVTKISAAVLKEEPIGFYSELPAEEPFPSGLVRCASMDDLCGYLFGIAVVEHAEKEMRRDHILILEYSGSRRIAAGIGCRRGTAKQQIKTALSKLLKEYDLKLDNVVKLASIDLKKNEPGILEFASEYHIPFCTYSASELKEVPGGTERSDFVLEVTGVDNVCERAARYCVPQGRLLQPKRIVDGLTFALAEEQPVLTFGSKEEMR